jgi:hypothetical protein
LKINNGVVLVMEMQCIFCDVGREFLHIIQMNFGLRRVNEARRHELYLTHLLLSQRLGAGEEGAVWPVQLACDSNGILSDA